MNQNDLAKLKELLHSSQRILITSHHSPDFDAVGSMLFMYSALQQLPDSAHTQIHMCIEAPIPDVFDYLDKRESISSDSLLTHIQTHKPDLLIMLDGSSLDRFTRSTSDIAEIQSIVNTKHIPTVIIDHHLRTEMPHATLYLNPPSSSTSEQVYNLCAQLGLQPDIGIHPDSGPYGAVMLGILGDTGYFRYENPHHRQTFAIVSELLGKGVSIENISFRTQMYSPQHITIFSELMSNFSQTDTYNYSYITDEFFAQHLSSFGGEPFLAAARIFANTYVRSVRPHSWGFVLIPHPLLEGHYKCLVRATGNSVDTTVLTRSFGGGGHKAASGFEVPAESLSNLLTQTHTTIEKLLTEAHNAVV